MQIRALRKSRELSQPELARLANMAQPRICEIEKPGERRPNLETLLRLANAFDVGLQVRFVPFDQLINDDDETGLDNLSIKTFDEIVKEAEEEEVRQASQKRNVVFIDAPAQKDTPKQDAPKAEKKRGKNERSRAGHSLMGGSSQLSLDFSQSIGERSGVLENLLTGTDGSLR